MVSNELAVAPPRRISKSSAMATSNSLAPVARRGRTAAKAWSATWAAAAMRATSPSSLTRRRASTSPSVGTSSAEGNHSRPKVRWRAQVTLAASKPSRRSAAAADARPSFWVATLPTTRRASTPPAASCSAAWNW
jgi:hypothetical protein